jgi:PAS domain-containing protein
MPNSLTTQTLHIERLADVIALPIGRWDSSARLVFCNSPYLAWAGRPREQLIGGTLEELFGVEAWAAAKPAFERAFQGEISSYERLLTHPPHPERWARIQVFPDTDPVGSVSSVFTIATDIHEDIVARDALVAARKRLDRFTENIPTPLTYLDQGCMLRFVNKAWSTITGISADNALGTPCQRGARRSKLAGTAAPTTKRRWPVARCISLASSTDWSTALAGCGPVMSLTSTRRVL